ncbi:transglutaminase-like cysteine peptidase [Vreelandella aquamarina]
MALRHPHRSSHAPPLSRRQFLAAAGVALAAGALGYFPTTANAFNPSLLRESMSRQYGARGLQTLEEWFALLDRLRSATIAEQLRDVNGFFNRHVRWRDDIQIWRQEDYWATPLETMGMGEADCEDYSIAKYITLKELGVEGSKLRMIYVRARIGRSQVTQAHMVLGFYQTPASEPLILDNMVASIQPASRRDDLDPVFSFNSSGLWAGGGSSSRADPMVRLSRWRNVVSRMQEQGFV